MFKKSIVLFLLFLLFTTPARAIYDPLSVPNNKYGIHILETSELDQAANIVNHNGDWGYVTIPIRANERNLPKWTKFMEDCRKLHLIPILRIASFPVDDHWMAPNEYDLIDFANFLDELPWPTTNRYVVIYNEPNHKNEWGGFVYPEEYARVLDRAIDIFHKTNQDFFVVSAGLDSSAPDSRDSENEYSYMESMNTAVPDIFKKIDGFSSHSYGNPAFSSYPNTYSSVSVANYRFEEKYLSSIGAEKPKIFITEAGWQADALGDLGVSRYFSIAFGQIWTDDNIVAITPFVLNAPSGPFTAFSFLSPNGNFKPQAEIIKSLPKTKGVPTINTAIKNMNPSPANVQSPNLPNSSNLIEKLLGTFFSLFSRLK